MTARQLCEWFALCGQPAAGALPHPILGGVPCCARCADLAGQTLQPVTA